MRALLLATGDLTESNAMVQRHLAPMLPLVDRPFVQHVIEYCVGQGVNEFDIVLSHLPEVLERHLGDGSRWGCRITYHLARDPRHPFVVLSRMGLEGRAGSRVLLGHADRLPIMQIAEVADIGANDGALIMTGRHGFGGVDQGEWTGWGLLHAGDLQTIARDMPASRLFGHLRASVQEMHLTEVNTVLSVRTATELLASERAVLDKKVSGLMFRSREKEPGVWISRHASISPKAVLKPPVFIGHHAIVGAAQVGPHAVIGHGCLVDRHCRVSNSSVFAGTYIGEGMILDGVVVDGELAVTPTAESVKVVADPLHLGRVPEVSLLGLLMSALPRLAALLLLLAASPVLLLTMLILAIFRRGKVLYRREAVRVPVAVGEGPWPTYRLISFVAAPEGVSYHQTPGLGHLLLRVLPGLVHVVRGDLHFVGVSPRSPDEVSRMAEEWRALYLQSKAGLIATTIFFRPAPREDERCAADAAYACNRTWRPWGQDFGMMTDYFWACVGLSLNRSFASETHAVDLDGSGMGFPVLGLPRPSLADEMDRAPRHGEGRPTGFVPADDLAPAADPIQ